MKRILISILNYNGSFDTIECIKSILKYEDICEYMVVIWDNASEKNQYEILQNYIASANYKVVLCDENEYCSCDDDADFVLVRSSINYGFAIANNKVIRSKLGKFNYYILLNNDTEFYEPAARKCIELMEQNDKIGILTSTIYYYYDNNKVWNAGGKFYFGWRKYYKEDYVNRKIRSGITTIKVDYITGCFMILKNNTVIEHGLLSEDFFFGEEDYNYCMRMKNNDVYLAAKLDTGILHKVGASTNWGLDKDRSLRLLFIHYLNRYIDMRSFYSRTKWNAWCILSSIICLRMIFKITEFDIGKANEFLRLLFKYRHCNGIDYLFFYRIMEGEVL